MPEVLLPISSYPSKKLSDNFELASRAGFDGIELDCTGFGSSHEKLYLLSVDHNILIKSVLAPRLCSIKPLTNLFMGDFLTHNIIECFKPGGITFNVPKSPVLKQLSLHFFRDRILHFINKYGKDMVSIENSAPSGTSVNKPIMGIKKIRDFTYEHDIYFNYDISNCAASGRDILETYDMIAPRVKNVHFSDYGGDTAIDHRIPGSGILPLGRLLSKMREYRYNGNITIELHPYELHNYDESELISLYRELIGYIRSYF